jgi:hypothetical protein
MGDNGVSRGGVGEMAWFNPITTTDIHDIVGIALGIIVSLLAFWVLLVNSRTSALKSVVDAEMAVNKELRERIGKVEAEHAALKCDHDKLRIEHVQLQQEHIKLRAAYDLFLASYDKAQEMIRQLQASVVRLEHENELLRKGRRPRRDSEGSPEKES